uniref:Uncharacterized protein n=1 Tax=Arundo donax TaxID=35708 RepID=A0A0A9BPL3_ARUDO
MQYSSKPRSRGIALDHKRSSKVRQLKNWH